MAFSDNPLEVFFDLVPTGAALYSPVFDASGELVDFRFARLNPAGQRLLGLPAQPPRTFCEYYPSSVPTGIFAKYHSAYLTGQIVTYEVPYAADGLDTFFRLVAQRSGELLVVNFTDMADLPLAEAEQALRASQAAERTARAEAEAERQRLYQVLMCMPAHIALLRGPEHVYELVNPEYERLFPARTTLGRTIREVIPDIAGQGFYELFDRVYETGEPFYAAETEAWADFAGTGQPQRRYYRTAFEPIRNAQGEVTEVLNFAVDVTAQVEARQLVEQLNQELETRVQQRTQQALALQADLLAAAQRQVQARETLYQVFEQTPAAICIQRGAEHRYEYVNAAYQQFFPDRVLVGRSVVEVIPEVVENGLLAQLDRVYQTGETFYANEVSLRLTQVDGTPYWAHVSFTYQAMREQGEIVGISTFVFDVTAQVLARREREANSQQVYSLNEELRESNRQLTRTNIDLDTFVYTASHDLKAPITNIESILLALRDTLPPDVQQQEEVSHLLNLLQQTVTRFQFTIGQLTDISQLQLAHTGPAEPVVLATVVEAVRLDLETALVAAGTQLTIEVAPELLVSFSPANLRSVVYNLLSNAVKYRAAGRSSRVRVHAEQTPHAVVLTVQDNGLGMSDVQQRQLFGLFQRLHTHVEGTGVGLYITKRLIENAGGAIAVQSAPDAGSTFVVTFPI